MNAMVLLVCRIWAVTIFKAANLSVIWLASRYIEMLKNVVILGVVFDYLAKLDPKLDLPANGPEIKD